MKPSTSPLRIAIRIPPSAPITEVADLARQAEEAGFDTVAIPDSPMLWRDTIAALCVAAISTSRVTLGLSVTNFVTRPPVILASAARTVADLAQGRFRVGIGAGDSAVNLTASQGPTKTGDIRKGVHVVRELLAGRPASEDSPNLVLHDPCGPLPIFIGATGPMNLTLAAEIADGVQTPFRGMPEKFATLDAAIASLKRERPLHTVVTVATRVTDDIEREAQLMKPSIANFARRDGGGKLLAANGFPVTVPSGHLALPDGTDLGHPRDIQSAVETAAQWISDDLAMWFVQNLCFFGTGHEIAERFLALSALGVDEVLCSSNTAFGLPTKLLATVGAEVIPRLRAG